MTSFIFLEDEKSVFLRIAIMAHADGILRWEECRVIGMKNHALMAIASW